LWTPGDWLSDSTIKNPIASPLRDIVYKVTVTNAAGCIAEDSVLIKVTPIDDIYMPTGFTPNNDGKNDVIRPGYGEKFILKEFTVYNRWGQKLFSTSQRSAGWNGKVNGLIQDTGVYVWIITAVDRSTNVEYKRKGVFVLIR
jgi:gliding motility-associated-like protein